MVTKAIIRSINGSGTKCVVEIPLFATAAAGDPVTAEALVSITPGLFGNLAVKDIVFIAFEENALELPVIIGKLFTGAVNENNVNGGAGIFNSLRVGSSARIPCSTTFDYPDTAKGDYKELNTPKKIADYIKWLESLVKRFVGQLDEQFICFKNWVQWQLQPKNVEVDDGDLDEQQNFEPALYQKETGECRICGNACPKNKTRNYTRIETDKTYPNI